MKRKIKESYQLCRPRFPYMNAFPDSEAAFGQREPPPRCARIAVGSDSAGCVAQRYRRHVTMDFFWFGSYVADQVRGSPWSPTLEKQNLTIKVNINNPPTPDLTAPASPG